MGRRVLVVDDEEGSRRGLSALLSSSKWGYEVEEASNGEEALKKALVFHPSVVIADLVMPGLDGIGLLKALQEEQSFATVVILTGQGTIESAVAAMKEGAYDYLTKPVDVARLRLVIQRAAEKEETLREVTLLRRRVKEVWGAGQLVGKNKAMQEVYRLIELAAPTSAPVLISGESGTGKELVARTIHERSLRNAGAFVAVNCAAIPDTLLESEVFGHEKGAFTGALERRVGCFELANGGTIFLDEIAEMSPALQAKFLRILEDGMVKRLGGKTEIKVDVRVVAATNKDPAKTVKGGAFREDLYYRLNVFNLALPPLKERREDIPLLVEAFIEEFNAKYDKRIKSVDEAALRILVDQLWPGNVRELRNAIERAVVVCEGDLMTPKHLSREPIEQPREDGTEWLALPVGMTLDEAEKQLIIRTLASLDNNKTRAAEILAISVKTLHNKLHRYGLADAFRR